MRENGDGKWGKWGKMGENGDSALFLEEKIGRCPHFPPGAVPIFPPFSPFSRILLRRGTL